MKHGGWAVPIGEVGVGLKLCRFIERPRPKCQCWALTLVGVYFLISWLEYQIAKEADFITIT